MIHKYSQFGRYIVLDTYSGAVHEVDELSYKLLDYTDEKMTEKCPEKAISDLRASYTEDDIKECYGELFELFKNEELYSPDTYADFAAMMGPAPIKSMCINIAHDCNLRCEYCFAAKGDFGTGRELMPLNTAKKCIDFIIKYSGGRHNLEVDFFGGEPLMNFDVVKKTVEYARSIEKQHNKNFRFTITTNGLLLDDEKIDFINREMNNVVLSLDGRREVNDRMRVTPNGKGSYDVIMPNFKKLVEKRGDKEYYIRGTFTKLNKDFAEDVMHIYNEGFDQISVEPVVSDPDLDYSIKEDDLPALFEEYDRLGEKIIELKRNGSHINFFHFMIDLDGGPCAIKRLRGCSCGNEYVAVTPNGDIYPCHQFVGKTDYIMGSVKTGEFDHDIQKEFSTANVYKKEKCRDCWAKFFCSGGCNANNLQYAGSILNPHVVSCEIERKRVEIAIAIKTVLADEGF